MTEVQKKLFEMQDLKYRDFHSKLMPTVDKDKIIGVRTPELRKFAKVYGKTPESREFLKDLPHKYYEEDNLHGFILEQIKDYKELINALDEFLPYVDNWATCDMMSPKVFKSNLQLLMTDIKRWITSEDVYMVRFAIVTLMKYYLEEDIYKPEYLQMVINVQREEYYIKMAIAWYIATALAKQYTDVLPALESKKMDVWIHNKAIQKAVESYRITAEQKKYLRTLRLH